VKFVALDPGTVRTAWVVYDTEEMVPVEFGLEPNELVLQRAREGFPFGSFGFCPARMALEMVASYGMPVGREIFEMVLWSGRFVEAFDHGTGPHDLVYRRDVKLHLCGTSRAKDTNVRRALLDKFPATGGGATPQVGTKAKPGPLYGFKADLWAALAVAVTYAETRVGRSHASVPIP